MTKRNKDVAKNWDIFHWDWFWKPFHERSIAKWLKSPSVDFAAFVYAIGFLCLFFVAFILWQVGYRILDAFAHYSITEEVSYARVLRDLLLSAAAIIGLPLIIWRTMIAQRQTATAEDKTDIDRQTHFTTLYTKSIELLGAMRVVKDDEGKDKSEPAMELRLGAIYALERIARESEKDHWPIMEVLTAYIRENSHSQLYLERGRVSIPNFASISVDCHAALTVIGRRNKKWISKEKEKNQFINLRHTNLNSANFHNLVFANADFSGSRFNLATADKANFQAAKFHDCNFDNYEDQEFFLKNSNFSNVEFYCVNFKNIDFLSCNFSEAIFTLGSSKSTNFVKCDLSKTELEATSPPQIKFDSCNLFEAKLTFSGFELINFKNSILCKTNAISGGAQLDLPDEILMIDTDTRLRELKVSAKWPLKYPVDEVLVMEIYEILKTHGQISDGKLSEIQAIIDKHTPYPP